jgi:hypothetical protein
MRIRLSFAHSLRESSQANQERKFRELPAN